MTQRIRTASTGVNTGWQWMAATKVSRSATLEIDNACTDRGLIRRLPIRPNCNHCSIRTPRAEMIADPVSTHVNYVRNDDEACIATAVQQ